MCANNDEEEHDKCKKCKSTFEKIINEKTHKPFSIYLLLQPLNIFIIV